MSDRPYPHDLDAERSILGAILVDNGLFGVAAARVRAEHFYRLAHRRIFEACGRLDAARVAIDFVTLREDLAAAGTLDEAGGPGELAMLGHGVPKASNVESYARIVREKATLRELIGVARQTLDEAFEEDDPSEIVGRAESRFLGLGRDTAGAFLPAADWMAAALRTIEANSKDRRYVTGVPTGLPALDRMTRGLQKSNLVLIGARTGIGKTSLALQMCLEASRHGTSAYFSAEMNADELAYRAVSLESSVDAFRLMTGNLSDRDVALIGQAAARIGERRLFIRDGAVSIHSFCADVRRLHATEALESAFVDYIGLVEGPKAENRTQEVAAVSRRLKAVAMELRIPVVALVQLSREAVKGAEKPQLHHLKESGSLEQDANLVLLLHRPGDGKYQDGEEAELIVAKQRSGPVGTIKLQWRASLTKFVEQTEGAAGEPQ